MIYDVAIIGAGASGLFAACSFPRPIKGIILEKNAKPGIKLLASGAGQCNITHGGSIKDFISHYGEQGSKIRSILYACNNKDICSFFEKQGLALLEREDGKIFPASLKAQDVLLVLLNKAQQNGFNIAYNQTVTTITKESTNGLPIYVLSTGQDHIQCKNLIIASGGSSYPATGSDGALLRVLQNLGFDIEPQRPALVPLCVKEYPYQSLSGLSFNHVKIKIGLHKNEGSLLYTHSNFSGPVILDTSRYAQKNDCLCIDYLPFISEEELLQGLSSIQKKNQKQTSTAVVEWIQTISPEKPHSLISKRFIEVLCKRINLDSTIKFASISGKKIKDLASLLKKDSFYITETAGFTKAMTSAGGVKLSEISLPSLESPRYRHVHIIGEALDVDGDSGGYNLQFAFSSGFCAAQAICKNF